MISFQANIQSYQFFKILKVSRYEVHSLIHYPLRGYLLSFDLISVLWRIKCMFPVVEVLVVYGKRSNIHESSRQQSSKN